MAESSTSVCAASSKSMHCLSVRPSKRVFENASARSMPATVTQRLTTLSADREVEYASQIGSSGLGIADAGQDVIAEHGEVEMLQFPAILIAPCPTFDDAGKHRPPVEFLRRLAG